MKSIKDLSDFHGLCSKNINIYFAETVWYMFIFIFFLVLRSFCDIKQKNANCVKLHKQTKLSFGNWCFCWHFYDKKNLFIFFSSKKYIRKKENLSAELKLQPAKQKKNQRKQHEKLLVQGIFYTYFFLLFWRKELDLKK